MANKIASKTPRPRTLGDDQRAEVFLALARTLSAGLDATQALSAIHGICNGALDAALSRAARAVASGTALLRALERNRLISAHDHPLLAVAESNGALEHACEQLAQRYQRAAARWRQLKGKLLLPAAVLVMAIILVPLPALVAGTLSIGAYVLGAAAMLMLVAILVRLTAMLIMHWRAHGTPGWLTRLARLLPMFGPLSQLHQRADVSERLALALRCGSPAVDAVQMMIHAEHNSLRKHALVGTRRALSGGSTLATALQGRGLLDAAGFAIVSTGEGAGRIDDSLARVAANDHDALDKRYSVIAQWLPVLAYVCVAGTALASLL